MSLWFMRHGQTNYNLQGLCNDDPGRDVHLSENGLKQAQQAADALRDRPFTHILVSQLPRTRQTAEIVNRHHRVPVRVCPELNDIRSGFDGQPVAAYFAAIAADPLHVRPPGGESRLEHHRRISRMLLDLQQQNVDNFLIVAHEETLRAAHVWFHRQAPQQLLEVDFRNCEVLEFSWP